MPNSNIFLIIHLILELSIGLIQPYKNGLYDEDGLLLINTCPGQLTSDVELRTELT
jgi:hypothetical protein